MMGPLSLIAARTDKRGNKALMQVLESVGAIFGGVAFDAFHLSERGVVLIMAGIAAAASVAWVAYAWSQWPKQAGSQEEDGREQEDEELLATELRR